MYRNTAWSNPGKLTKPASNRSTSQLEGYHGDVLKELLQSANTSSELATKLLTLANRTYQHGQRGKEQAAPAHAQLCIGTCYLS